jgi:hypothetical protein
MNAAGAYFNRNLDSSDAKTSSATPKLTVPPKNFRTQDRLVEIYEGGARRLT